MNKEPNGHLESASSNRMKPIPEFDGYCIDENGEIWSFMREGTAGALGKRTERPKKLKPTVAKSGKGYLCVTLRRDGKHHWKFAHKLVLETWKGPCPFGMIARHLDGNKFNNAPSNLEWGTYQENEADKRRHNTSLTGSRHHQAKLTEEQVLEIRSFGRVHGLPKELAKRYGVSVTNIYDILHRRIWRHI